MSYSQSWPVLIGLGANLPSQYGPPQASLIEALRQLALGPVTIVARSPWYESAPVPASDQPWYVNAAIAGVTLENPNSLLQFLHKLEIDFSRERGVVNAPRPLDLDLLAYGELVTQASAKPQHGIVVLPHPRMQERPFVLRPLTDIAPNWRHPVLKSTAGELLNALPANHEMRLARGSDALQ
jgi:2-amino-4-hydroxy-6-hydroxymethyldihydropteridine diphosphokinase